MNLTKIDLINFRNYSKCSIKLNEKVNIFIGNNAQGKTNILESIYVLALTKSYRTNYDDNLKKKGSDSYKIKGDVRIGKYLKKSFQFAKIAVCHNLAVLPFPSLKGCIKTNS